ncbi:hypothetical protein BH23GEM4_BH23GEM4_02770 [soil metagenome]
MFLPWLTLIVALAIVLVLAGYLIAVAWALLQAKGNVARLGDGLEAIAGHTEPLTERITTIDGALRDVATGFAAVERHLGGAAGAFEQ